MELISFLPSKDTREILTWVGGGLIAAAGVFWKLIQYFRAEPTRRLLRALANESDPIALLRALANAGKRFPMDRKSVGDEVYFVAHEDGKYVWLMPYCRFRWNKPPLKSCRSELLRKISDAEISGPKKLAEVLEGGKRDGISVHWQSIGSINGQGLARARVFKPTRLSSDRVSSADASSHFVIEDDYD